MIREYSSQVAIMAYNAYGDYVEWKDYQGLPMPKWEELPEKIQVAWLKAGIAAVEGYHSLIDTRIDSFDGRIIIS